MSDTQKFDFIINRRSGTVLNLGEEAVKKSLSEIFGERAGKIKFVEGKDVASTVKTWAAEHKADGPGLIIGGGDGTVLTAAAEVLGRDDIALGVLPLGTHNLFARQLGFAADFKEAAKQYKGSVTDKVDVGVVNGMHFLVGLMIDQNSVSYYDAREDVRDGNRLKAAGKLASMAAGLTMGFKSKLKVSEGPEAAAEELKARVFAVTNHQLAPRSNKGPQNNESKAKAVVENMFAKDTLNDGKLGFYAFDAGMLNMTAILGKVWNGTWDQHSSVRVKIAPQLYIQPGDKKDEGKEISIVLDGEIKKINYPLDIRLIPGGLKVFRPGKP